MLKTTQLQETIEDLLNTDSYQYNLKFLGVSEAEENVTAEQSVDVCPKLFKEMSIKVLQFDIDIAHRIPIKKKSIPAPTVCKFTRRITKEALLQQKKS